MRLRIVLNAERCVIGVPPHAYLVEDLANYIKGYFDLSSSVCLLVDDFLVPNAEVMADVLRDNDVVEVRVNPANKRQRSSGDNSDAEHVDANDAVAEKAVLVASSTADDDSRSDTQPAKKAKVAVVTKTSPATAKTQDALSPSNEEQPARKAPPKTEAAKAKAPKAEAAKANASDDSSSSDDTPKAKKPAVKAKVKAPPAGLRKTAAVAESSSDESSSDDARIEKKPAVKAKVKAPPVGIRKTAAVADSSSDESVAKKPAVKAKVKATPAGIRKTAAVAEPSSDESGAKKPAGKAKVKAAPAEIRKTTAVVDSSSDESSSDGAPVAKKHIVPRAKAAASSTASPAVAPPAKAAASSGAKNNVRTSHNPVASEGNGTKLFVGALAQAVTEAELRAHFSQFGQVAECTILMDNIRKRSRGYAFLIMGSPEDAQAVLAQSHTLQNRTVDIKMARPRTQKPRKEPPTTSSTPIVPVASSAQAQREARQQLLATEDQSCVSAAPTGAPNVKSTISMPTEPVSLEVAQAVALELARVKKLELARKADEARKAEQEKKVEEAQQAECGKKHETEEDQRARARRYEEEYERQCSREAEEIERAAQQQEAWARVLSCPADAPEDTPTEISTEEEVVNPDAEMMRSMGLPVAFAGDAQTLYDEE